MITSAQALNQFLAAVLQKSAGNEKFLTAAARVLNLDGDDAEVRALTYVHRLLRRVKADIDDLPFDSSTKSQAYSYLAPFNPLVEFAHFHLDVQNAKSSFLHPSHLVGLTNLHMALWGNVASISPSKELLEISGEFRDYIIEIHSLELPDNVKRAIHVRLQQIASMLEHYFFYGGEAIKDELEALAGAIVLNMDKADDAGKNVFRKAAESIARAFGVLATTDTRLGILIGVTKKGSELLGLFGKP